MAVRAGGRLPAPQSPARHGAAVCRCAGKLPHCAAHHSGGGCNGAVRRLCVVLCRAGRGVVCRCTAWVGRTGHRRFCGERLLGAAENPAAQFCGAGGHTVLWPCAAAQSVGRRVLRVRRGFCCAGSGQAGCLCDALRPDAPAVHGGMVPVCAGCLCGAGAGAGVQADPGGEARHFCGSSQLYTALLRECEAAGH